MADDILTTFDDSALQAAERRAWREAARCWREYGAADAERQRLGGSSAPDDVQWLAQSAHDTAWSAEHAWRGLHDERVRRGLRIAEDTGDA